MYGYTSSVDVATAPSAGLAGALVVAGRGQLVAGPDGSLLPRGVDLMVPLYWQVGAGGWAAGRLGGWEGVEEGG